jgi:peptidoglycan/LPS O-acetylase OafA/YrhL
VLYTPFHTHCDGLLAGLIVSNLFADPNTKQVFSHRLLPLSVPLCAIAALALRQSHHAVFGYTALALVFGAAVATCAGASTRWTRLLEGRALHLIARLSFGMYLNYRFLLPTLAHAVNPAQMPGSSMLLVSLYAVTVVSAGALAAVTFVLIERPFLRLRGSLLRRWASQRGDRAHDE